MFMVLRGLPALFEIGLLIYCLIEVIQTPTDEVRNLGKGWWILLIIFFPIVGGIAWLFAGRPKRRQVPSGGNPGSGFPEYGSSRRAPLGPDDDLDFLSELDRANSDHEETLKNWEADLARREAEQRRKETGPEE